MTIFNNIRRILTNKLDFLLSHLLAGEANDTDQIDSFVDRIDEFKFSLNNNVEHSELINTIKEVEKLFKEINLVEIESELKIFVIYSKLSLLLKDYFYDPDENYRFNIKIIPSNEISINYFGYTDANDVSNSIGYINFEKLISSTSNEDLDDCGVTKTIIYGFFKCISNSENMFKPDSCYVILENNDISTQSCSAIIKLIALSKGVHVHQPLLSAASGVVTISRNPMTSDNKDYQQFNETFLILSEMICHTDVLSKFFSLYHVIENYLYRTPIIELHSQGNGDMFSIREFKRLYEKTAAKEINILTQLFSPGRPSGLWSRVISGSGFNIIVKEKFKLFKNDQEFVENDYKNFVKIFPWFDDHRDIKNTPPCSIKYCNLIYNIRNSIVHNKETEFHLSHFNLNKTIGLFIDRVLIEPITILVFDLISDSSSPIWYHHDQLQLYKK